MPTGIYETLLNNFKLLDEKLTITSLPTELNDILEQVLQE